MPHICRNDSKIVTFSSTFYDFWVNGAATSNRVQAPKKVSGFLVLFLQRYEIGSRFPKTVLPDEIIKNAPKSAN